MRPEYPKLLLSALALFVWVQTAERPAEAQPVTTVAKGPPAASEPGPESTEAEDLAESCPRILLRSMPAFLFVDGFESGDTSVWN